MIRLHGPTCMVRLGRYSTSAIAHIGSCWPNGTLKALRARARPDKQPTCSARRASRMSLPRTRFSSGHNRPPSMSSGPASRRRRGPQLPLADTAVNRLPQFASPGSSPPLIRYDLPTMAYLLWPICYSMHVPCSPGGTLGPSAYRTRPPSRPTTLGWHRHDLSAAACQLQDAYCDLPA
jgi:hypothetical protein